MPTSVAVNMRCFSKTLVVGVPPAGGGDPVDSVSVQLQQTVATADTSSSSCNVTLPVASDTFAIGGYYDMSIADGVAPLKAGGQSHGSLGTGPIGQAPPLGAR